MELRLVTTEEERRIFTERVEQVRAKQGYGFREGPRSRLGSIHLTFGNLYGLYEEDDAPARKMIAGLVMHDLEMFPQTCPRPDLSHLPPRSVIEVSELWSCAVGAGALARAGAAILAGLLDTQAILAYLSVKPFDGTAFYAASGFVKVGEPLEYPYLATLTGEKILAQPMILAGEALEKLTRVFSSLTIEASADCSMLRFRNFLQRKAQAERPVLSMQRASMQGGSASRYNNLEVEVEAAAA